MLPIKTGKKGGTKKPVKKMEACSAISSVTLSLATVQTGAKLFITNRNRKPFVKQSRQFKICCRSTSLYHSKLSPPNEAKKKKNNNNGRREANIYNDDDYENSDFVVVNFYKFVFIKDPEEEVAKHLAFVEYQDLNIHGRIYLNEQGINAQYSGPSKDALAYVDWLREDEKFSDILVQISPALNGHAFPKLKLRYKPSLVQLEGGVSHLPLLDHSMHATPLAPSEWRNRLEAGKGIDQASNSDLNRDFILLDVRNALEFEPISMDLVMAAGAQISGVQFAQSPILGLPELAKLMSEFLRFPDSYFYCYEWDIGHFHGARRPEVDCFRSTSFGLSEQEAVVSDPLADIDKEKTDILMYCTGGIRCDVYSTILRQHGFQNLYTLKGGVSHYLENEGPVAWVGNLFVFDSRLSLPPSTYKPEAVSEESMTGKVSENPFATCYVCGSQVCELRHRNCANLDCNLLFLCCADCVKNLCGCCCLNCTTASRLRPVLPGHQRYKKWHMYRDSDMQSHLKI